MKIPTPILSFFFSVIALLSLALPTASYAQIGKDSVHNSKWYVDLKAGYGIAINGSYNTDYVGFNEITYTSKIGNGIDIEGSAGYQITNNIAFELGIHGFSSFQNNLTPPHNTIYDNAAGHM